MDGSILVNSIPSLGNPAQVLAQAASSNAPYNVNNVNVTAGDYYIIIDNWPTPNNFYFALDLSFTAVSAPAPTTLVAPAMNAQNVALLPTLSWNAAAFATGYKLSLWSEDRANIILDEELVDGLTYTLTQPLEYETVYSWKVVPTNHLGDAVDCPTWYFTTQKDPIVHQLPWNEGFEDNDTQDAAIVGWTQAGTAGSAFWKANTSLTSYNRTPRSGVWNAYLQYSNTRWMFKGIELKGGTDYQISLYARQDVNAGATLKIAYGDADTPAAMTNTIVDATNIVSVDYQELGGVFSPAADGVYYIGILATLTGSPWYISIDDISVAELLDTDPEPPILVAPSDGADEMPIDGFDLQWQANLAGGVPDDYLVYLSMDKLAILESVPFTTANTIYNPVTEGLVEFGYEETWYWTVVARRNGVEVASDDVFSFTIESHPRRKLPYTQDFGIDGSFPRNWTQTYSGGLTSDCWSVSNTSLAGGAPNEMNNTWQNNTGISRLITNPLDTDGISKIVVKFKHYLSGFGTGCTGKLQYSYNLIDWVDTEFDFDTNDDIFPTEESVNIDNLSAPTTYIAWVMDGNHYQFNYWYIDDVKIDIAYDYPENTPIIVGDGEDAITITMEQGAANNVPGGTIPPVNNAAFIQANGFVLALMGDGPWIIRIETTAPWGAYYRNGSWTAVENTSGTEIVFDIPAAKGAKAGEELAIVLGDDDPTLPITLSSFTAVLTADLHVKIAWIAESETDHAGYNLLRSEVDKLATAIRINSALINQGEENGSQIAYSYTDSEVYPASTYYYWLESQSLNGETEYYGPLQVQILAQDEEQELPVIPMETKLYSAFPNPFNPTTNLRYSMKEAGEVMIQVYNVKGQLLKTFHNKHDAPGYYQVSWDGRDARGKSLSTGVYFYRMTSGKYSATKKMVLSK